MTSFLIVCAAMIVAALVWMVMPLLRHASAGEDVSVRNERRVSGVVVAVAIPVLAIAMYAGLSNWDWKATEQAAARTAEVDQMLRQLEAKLAENPTDVTGWLLLGRANMQLQRYTSALPAFQKAYDLSQGQDLEAVIGLGEALALTDESALLGRAGELFEAALAKEPSNPKALWFGAVAALQAGDLRLGRDRLQLMLTQNPPEELRTVLERQIQDLDQQLAQAGQDAPSAAEGAPAANQRVIRVSVSIAPQISKQLTTPVPLFIVARDPAAAGPPLAVKRRSSADLPLTIELSERDAMMPSRTIAGVPRVEVVARLSKTGSPQAQSGDFYGQADYDFAPAAGQSENKGSGPGGTLNIIIDRIVP